MAYSKFAASVQGSYARHHSGWSKYLPSFILDPIKNPREYYEWQMERERILSEGQLEKKIKSK
jgi:hypothetical protein